MSHRLRGAALFPLAALLVHQARYWVASGGSPGRMLGEQGHAYLGLLTPLVTVLAAGAVGAFVARLVAPDGAEGSRSRWPAWAAWLALAAALLAVYTGQESLEGLLSSGHPAGVAGVVGDGGWLAVPAALAIAAALCFLLRLSEAVLARVAAQPRGRRLRSRPPRRPAVVDRPRTAPLALRAAGRAPPAGLSVHS